jgi:creatinine amidohydrolase
MNHFEAPVRLGDMIADQFKDLLVQDLVVLLPLGSHEDHGPRVPMGDYILADTLAARIAKAASLRGIATVVAPTLPFGVADYFGCTPGGLALTSTAFKAVLTDLLAGLRRHGLDKIIILNGHGGNVPVIHEVTLALQQAGGPVIPSFYLWKVARQLMEARLGAGQHVRFGHGAEPLLSLSLALRPHECRDDFVRQPSQSALFGLPITGFGTLAFEGVSVDVPTEFNQVPDDARLAAGPLADVSLGEAIATELVDVAASFVCHFAAHLT